MSSHLAIVASLGLALLMSPETLVLGLVIASDRKVPRTAARMFAVGGVLGISFALALGTAIAPSSGAPAGGHHHTWVGFGIRAAIAAALVAIGLRRAASAFEQAPVPDVSAPKHRAGALWTWFERRAPRLARQLDPRSDLPPAQVARRAAIAGFAACGLHPKIFPVAIAAAHQIAAMSRHRQGGAALLFVALSAAPAVAPAILEQVRPGAAVAAKEGFERVMEVYGRGAVALLLLGVGVLLARDAWHAMPR